VVNDPATLVPLVLALLFGLGVPKSFSLLYVALAASAWLGWRRPGLRPSALLIWSALWLLLFGVSYAVFQVGWQVWSPAQAFLPEILAVVVLPSAGLVAGWLLQRFGRPLGTRLILAYVFGALIYALLALALSRTPWWNPAQTFPHVLRVPWGPEQWLSTRAVEQRSFLALTLLPVGIPLLLRSQARLRWLGVLSVVLAGLALHFAWAVQGRLGWAALVLAALPWLCWIRRSSLRWLLAGLAGAVLSLAIGSGKLCDERWWLVNGFLQRLGDAPWGGRLIQYTYQDCKPGVWLRFGSSAGTHAFTPHNLVLDIYNDAGWIPCICLLVAVLPLMVVLLRGFWASFTQDGWDAQIALRWSILCVLLVQWLAQPFLYTDQLMFSLGFVLVGVLLADFSSRSPGDWPAARPSHRGRSL
jgi:hypothetical protein